MPRGIPNVKRDDTQGMRYTTFHVPLQPNPKHMSTSYLKSDAQTLWTRNAARQKATGEDIYERDHVLVVHPGSRFLRVGLSTSREPKVVPNVIARKVASPPAPAPLFIEGISRPRKGRARWTPPPSNGDEYAVPPTSDDPFDEKLSVIQISLRDRMRFYKLRVTPDAANKAALFNEQLKPEIIPEENDPFRTNWIQGSEAPFLVGEDALRLSDSARLGYVLRWPIVGKKFNTRDYPSNQMIIDDIEAILRDLLHSKLDIVPSMYKDFSVVLVIPDFYDRSYVRDMVQLLLKTLGFKQLCAQQESLAATYGAGISSACVVDIGATTSSIACVDEGMVIPDTRMFLNMGGDYITEFLYVLLERIGFPYRDINLARSYDWNVMEDLKARLCTLAEGDVALNLYDFVVRQPGKPAEKYGLRAYDEIILAPMCLFEPRVIDFDSRRIGMRPFQHPDVSDEISDHRDHRDALPADHYTQAMIISTQHLFAAPGTVLPPNAIEVPDAAPSGVQTPSATGKQGGSPPPSASEAQAESGATSADSGTTPTAEPSTSVSKAATPPPPSSTVAEETAPQGDVVPIDVDAEVPPDATAATTPVPSEPAKPVPAEDTSSLSKPLSASRFDIDISFEASKLPMDVAIFNSTRAAGGDEKIRKYLQAVLVVGGTALVPGMSHALESRLQAIATPLVSNMDKVQIIPPPKDVDPRILAWKGASVLGRMDGVADLWLTPTDWDLLGMRGLRERCFYL